MTPNDPRYGYGAPPGVPPNPMNPYPPPPYGPPVGYPAVDYPGRIVATNDNEAMTIFILGLLGLVACQFLAPVAWAKGSSYRTTCRVMEVPPNGLATAGWILGIVGSVTLALSLLGMVAMIAIR